MADPDPVHADFEQIRDLLVEAAAPAASSSLQRNRLMDVLTAIDRFVDSHPGARRAEIAAIRQITLRALEVD